MPRLKPLWERAEILESQMRALQQDALLQGVPVIQDVLRVQLREFDRPDYRAHQAEAR